MGKYSQENNMPIKEFELLHGAVLVKLMLKKKPVTLRLIETREDNWAVYTIDEKVELFIKRSSSPQDRKKGHAWLFTFTSKQLLQLYELSKKNPIAMALVCWSEDESERQEICFIEQNLFTEIMMLEADPKSTKSILVKYVEGKRRLFISTGGKKYEVKLNAIKDWEIP
jgi:hypothetical protein